MSDLHVHLVSGMTPKVAFEMLAKHMDGVHSSDSLIDALLKLDRETLAQLLAASMVAERVASDAMMTAGKIMERKYGMRDAQWRWRGPVGDSGVTPAPGDLPGG